MKSSLLIKIRVVTVLCFLALGGGFIQSKPSDEERAKNWIYAQHYEIFSYLLKAKNAQITKDEQRYLATQAYRSFFEYWILHQSAFKVLDPDSTYEQTFSKLIYNKAMPSLDADDPLLIKQYYLNGVFVSSEPTPKIAVPEFALYPRVEGLPYTNLKKWSDYQSLVSSYKTFITNRIKHGN